MIFATGLKQERSLPILIVVSALLLLADGVLALFGCIAYPGSIPGRTFDTIGSAVILATGLSILMNHRTAVYFACASAVLLTIDQLRELASVGRSVHITSKTAHLFINVAFYWVMFELYRRWFRTSSRFVGSDEPGACR